MAGWPRRRDTPLGWTRERNPPGYSPFPALFHFRRAICSRSGRHFPAAKGVASGASGARYNGATGAHDASTGPGASGVERRIRAVVIQVDFTRRLARHATQRQRRAAPVTATRPSRCGVGSIRSRIALHASPLIDYPFGRSLAVSSIRLPLCKTAWIPPPNG